MRNPRRLAVGGLAALVVAGLLWADVVTLQRAQPNFRTEERNIANLMHHNASTTTLPPRPPTATTRPTTPSP